jgi:hypothetical protein
LGVQTGRFRGRIARSPAHVLSTGKSASRTTAIAIGIIESRRLRLHSCPVLHYITVAVLQGNCNISLVSMSNIDDDDYFDIFPVFCTAKIPAKVFLNALDVCG